MAYFNGILGDVGSGKTNIMTRYLYHSAKAGSPIVTNYKLIGIKHRLIAFSEFAEIMGSKNETLIRKNFEGCVFAWDELGIGADSYDFFAKDNRNLTRIVANIRKFSMTGFYTVQRYSMVVRRLRIMTGSFLFMTDADAGKLIGPDGKRAKRHRDICQGIFWGQLVNDYLEPIGQPRPFNGKPYWNMYDTNEVVWA